MNKTIQVARIANDPEYTPGDDNKKSRIKFGGYVAKRMKKENEKDNIFNYIAFGSTADFINRNFKKGQMALITSEVNNNHYEDKDGKKQFREQFIVESIEFYGYKNENDSSDKKEDSPKATTTDTPKEEVKEDSKPAVSDDEDWEDF